MLERREPRSSIRSRSSTGSYARACPQLSQGSFWALVMLECCRPHSSAMKWWRKNIKRGLQPQKEKLLSLSNPLSFLSMDLPTSSIFYHLLPLFNLTHSLSIIFLASLPFVFPLLASEKELWRSWEETQTHHLIPCRSWKPQGVRSISEAIFWFCGSLEGLLLCCLHIVSR